MVIVQKDETTFEFTSRGTDYTICKSPEDIYGPGMWSVYTDRLGRMSATVKMLSTTDMLTGYNKTLKDFAAMVALNKSGVMH